jgi:antitoxin (DNA-binding transcriptional repressor) of toxin-antitoxin stability system
MRAHIINATQASRTLSDILNQVRYQGISFEIKRGREIIAKIVPATRAKQKMTGIEFNTLLKRLPSLDAEDSAAFELELKEMRSHLHSEDTHLWD